jgi:hypothetical protein
MNNFGRPIRMNGQVLEADKAVVSNLPDCAKVRSNPYDRPKRRVFRRSSSPKIAGIKSVFIPA